MTTATVIRAIVFMFILKNATAKEQPNRVSSVVLCRSNLYKLRGGMLAPAPPLLKPRRSKGLTRLLLIKSALTALSGIPVLLSPKNILDNLGFPTITPPHVHMTKMWGVWMCCFQTLLEASFGLYVGGLARNLFVFIEGVFEVALLMEVIVDRRTINAAHYSDVVENTYILTVLAFFTTLFNAPDPVVDIIPQHHAMCFVGLFSILMLGFETASLKRQVDAAK